MLERLDGTNNNYIDHHTQMSKINQLITVMNTKRYFYLSIVFNTSNSMWVFLVGVKISAKNLKAMNNRYSDREGHVNFVDLVQCLVRLAGIMGIYCTKCNSFSITILMGLAGIINFNCPYTQLGHYENRVNTTVSGKATFKMDEVCNILYAKYEILKYAAKSSSTIVQLCI